MNNETPGDGSSESVRVLVIGRSPSVLVAAVELLREKGHRADVTNQFDQVLEDYDVSDLDIVVFGGMVPPDTKQYLHEEVTRRNASVTFVQGLAGIPGLIAAQVEATAYEGSPEIGEVAYDEAGRAFQLTLDEPQHVTVEALWGTSFTPPEPTSTSTLVFDGELASGVHVIALPEEVPDVASFAAVTVGAQVRVVTIGAMPQAVSRMVPKSAGDQRLPGVAAVATGGEGRGDGRGV
jgi:hypothetical protein